MKKQIHGGDIYRNKNVIDFSANTNPLGPPKGVIEAAARSLQEIEHYPDIHCSELRRDLAIYEGVEEGQIVFGNGAAEVIFSLVQAKRPKKALVQAPTFLEYEQALRMVGCQVEYYETTAEESFVVNSSILDRLTEDVDILFLCNPNNPTGMLISPELLEKIVDRCQEMHVLFVLDECFNDFIEEPDKYTMKHKLVGNPYLFILKAFTKRYAMAGIRLGYGLSDNERLLEMMQEVTQPWNVSIPAQAAGVAALKETKYVEQAMKIVHEQRPYMMQCMKEMGLKVYDSKANYIFFEGNDELYDTCLEEGILIRDCSNYPGLKKGCYRIAVKRPEENAKILQVLKRVIGVK